MRVGVLVGVLLLSASCRFTRAERAQPLDLDFTQVLPAGWAAAGAWQEVNLDGDADVEYLLLFTFDQGQVGAAIFDSQIASDVVGVVSASATPAATPEMALYPVPLQPFGYFRPYRLLPSYWSYTYGGAAGQGVVAMPRDKENLLAIQVGGPAPAESADRQAPVQPAAELVIRGGDTHLTFVWWRNAQYGYGVTQLAAEGGFRGVDWATWQKNPLPIEEIAGLYPLTDYRARSLVCREIHYQRRPPLSTGSEEAAGSAEAGGELPVIAFDEEDRGLTFCLEPAPAHPYYPEGVALAYLLAAAQGEGEGAGQTVSDALLTPGTDAAQLAADVGVNLLAGERVEDVAAHVTAPTLPANLQNGASAPTTAVCVELAQRADPRYRRWLVFTLRYQPPDMESGLPDRWTISGASPVPAPPASLQTPYCEAILAQG